MDTRNNLVIKIYVTKYVVAARKHLCAPRQLWSMAITLCACNAHKIFPTITVFLYFC